MKYSYKAKKVLFILKEATSYKLRSTCKTYLRTKIDLSRLLMRTTHAGFCY